MFHVALDIHTKRISICALDEKGQVVHRSQVRGIQDMVRVLTGLPDRFEVCYEAGCGVRPAISRRRGDTSAGRPGSASANTSAA
jgi:hypothetical protein